MSKADLITLQNTLEVYKEVLLSQVNIGEDSELTFFINRTHEKVNSLINHWRDNA